MATQTDLWGDLGAPANVRTPVAILREQAALLGQKTQNIVEAKVESEVESGQFYHSFNLVVPSLDNYTYQLFRIRHWPDLYPVYALKPAYQQLDGEEEFMAWLRERLSSNDTKRLISNLMAQASS
jgi:hypothetical protein